jgi:16S rRNA (uracil1498-N3)-methyltransferase
MRRFFIDRQAIAGSRAFLAGTDAHHLLRVLRLKTGDEVELFDGSGMVYQAKIEGGDLHRVELAVLAASDTPPDRLAIHLGQAMLKVKKMDLVVQKCTELGVRAIHPLLSTHTKNPAPGPEKLARWQRIIQESCKQCNQPWPPTCHPARSFAEVLAAGEGCDLRLICWEQPEAPPLRSVVNSLAIPRSIMVLIGPEGGFSTEEIAQARAAGFLAVGLGRRILRAETAAIAVIALLQYIFNDLD